NLKTSGSRLPEIKKVATTIRQAATTPVLLPSNRLILNQRDKLRVGLLAIKAIALQSSENSGAGSKAWTSPLRQENFTPFKECMPGSSFATPCMKESLPVP
ncbi:MAG: hypothetical protein JSV50_19695, partial [Desulfobacteraceae bacterium]